MSKQLSLPALPSKAFIEQLIGEMWVPGTHDHQKVTVETNVKTRHVLIRITRMYEYVDLTFSMLKSLSDRLGCEEINESRSSSDGCETCNYGSTYTIELDCWNFEKESK